MQSILSVSAPQKATLEANNVTESEASADEKIGEEKESSRFSDVMDSAMEEEVVSESDLQASESEDVASEDLLSEDLLAEGELLDSELFTDSSEEAGLELAGELNNAESESEETELEVAAPDELELDPLLENESIEKVSALGSSITEAEGTEEGSTPLATLSDGEAEAMTAIKVESESPKSTVNPILAQIETAQKVDTKVSDVKPEIMEDKAEAAFKMSNKWFEETNKSTKLEAESVLNVGMKGEEEGGSEVLLRSSNKLDNFISPLKTEPVKPLVTTEPANNELTSVGQQGATTSDKAAAKVANSTPLMQSTLLQQPIELQSKQLSAVMGERIMMMVNQGKHEVTIRLDPAELGSMHIKMQVHQEQLQVSIHTQVAQSRDIIEQNLPKLREQLAEQGISLGDANVEQQNQQQQSQSQNTQDESISSKNSMRGIDPLLGEQSEWHNTQIPIPAQGIDYYA